MKTNKKGMNLIKSLEGCRLKAYKLKGERNYTIGYGHSDATIKAGDTITQAQADILLIKDLEKFENYVTKYAVSKFPELNENQFSALVSYCYNRGVGGLKELIKFSDSIIDVRNNIVIFWGKNKNYKDALIKRREKETALFCDTSFSNVSRETSTLTVPKPVLKRGSRGTQVRYLQEFLNTFKYGLKCDGVFGENTYRALCDFQYRHSDCGGIDGIYGNHTMNVVRNIIRG